MEKKIENIFQVDSAIVNSLRVESANYSIEIDTDSPNKNLCVIWFSSNAIYYPNNESNFKKSIIDQDYYEWRTSTPISAYKHIFIRDIFKQWYIKGINKNISTPDQMLEFLLSETEGYQVITVGSSAGGYAACLYGQKLNALRAFVFNPQFEVNTLLNSTTDATNPLLFRMQHDSEIRLLYDIVPVVKNVIINYFVSIESSWDAQQLNHLGFKENIVVIKIRSDHHGVPFPRIALGTILSTNQNELNKLNGKTFTPIGLSVHFVGIAKTILGTFLQGMKLLKKKLNNG